MTGRLLGVDYGTRRVGLAICDPDRMIASPLETYERKDSDTDGAHFKSVITSEKVVAVVVGLPMHTDGREGVKAQEARAYGAWLKGVTDLPVVFWDERFTTVHAESALWNAGLSHQKRKDRRDRVAAQMMLQSYLEAKCPQHEGAEPN